MKRVVILLILVLLLGIAAVACGPGEEPSAPPSPPGGEQPTQPVLRPDLVISTIEVIPAQPQSGQFFSLNIYVANQGQASSGDYDVAINIQDISHGGTYPIGTFRQGAMHPGEDYCVYTSANVLVNDPGSYQVNVEIIPFLFDDGNTGNNSVSKPFTAK